MEGSEWRVNEICKEARKELIDYYKWIVTIEVFVLTVSMSAARIGTGTFRYQWLIITGWMCLGVSIFLNWLIVKRLVTLPIVLGAPRSQRGALHRIFLGSMRNIQRFGLLQNLLFLVGTIAISAGFVLNIR